jgi:two-component system, LuxR family, response regulator FixJ
MPATNVNERKPTVFIVDDESAVRDALGLLIKSAGLSAERFDSACAFLQAYDPERPGCLLLDVCMNDMSGLDLQETLRNKKLPIPIIFITGHGDVAVSARAFRGGAIDFIEKPFDDQTILSRIAEALEKDGQSSKKRAMKDETLRRYKRLTPREREVMKLVIGSRSNKQIARILGISHRTVDAHRARVMEKMGADSLAQV